MLFKITSCSYTSCYCQGNCRITQFFLAVMENLNHRFVTCFIAAVSGIFQTSLTHQCDLQGIPFFKEIGFALVGHVIDTRSHVQPYDCLWSCKANPRCFSVNIKRVRRNSITLKRVQNIRSFLSSVILVSTRRLGNYKFAVTHSLHETFNESRFIVLFRENVNVKPICR